MNDNTQRFSGRAEDYDRYRQRYPAQQIIAHLALWCGLTPEWRIADVGAGTGMLSEVFLENGNDVIAIEPNQDMRECCERLVERWPRLRVLDATAEATKLPDASIEMVAAGRAFHWFDRDRALAEFRRIAVPGGWLALISQGRARDAKERGFGEQTAAFEDLLTRLGTDYTRVRRGYRVHESLRELFPAEQEFHHLELPGTEELDWDAFRGQTLSLSVTPQSGHPAHGEFLRELRRLFEFYASAGVITIPSTCYITAARLSTR